MIKLIVNNDLEHIITINEMNYSATLAIDNFSQHQENINLNINLTSLNSIQYFENTKITSLQLLTQEDTNIVTLTFTEDIYFTSYNANIYDENARVYVSITKINRPEIEE